MMTFAIFVHLVNSYCRVSFGKRALQNKAFPQKRLSNLISENCDIVSPRAQLSLSLPGLFCQKSPRNLERFFSKKDFSKKDSAI